MLYLFVGERPSPLAAKIGATWQNGKLAAKQLHDALRAVNIDPATCAYINLWSEPGTGPIKRYPDTDVLLAVFRHIAEGYVVVGMGQLVSRELRAAGIPHLLLIHPAARGAIRKKERYAAHVARVLSGGV